MDRSSSPSKLTSAFHWLSESSFVGVDVAGELMQNSPAPMKQTPLENSMRNCAFEEDLLRIPSGTGPTGFRFLLPRDFPDRLLQQFALLLARLSLHAGD